MSTDERARIASKYEVWLSIKKAQRWWRTKNIKKAFSLAENNKELSLEVIEYSIGVGGALAHFQLDVG